MLPLPCWHSGLVFTCPGIRPPHALVGRTAQGADTVIYERLAVGHPTNEALRDVTLEHMEDYGSAGLRTLCLAFKELDTAFYDE